MLSLVSLHSMLCTFFCRVDLNKDRSISAKELQRWIMQKTEEHFQEAVKENKLNFHAVDPDGDGKLGYLYQGDADIKSQTENVNRYEQ